jgi:hypothetical protein
LTVSALVVRTAIISATTAVAAAAITIAATRTAIAPSVAIAVAPASARAAFFLGRRRLWLDASTHPRLRLRPTKQTCFTFFDYLNFGVDIIDT